MIRRLVSSGVILAGVLLNAGADDPKAGAAAGAGADESAHSAAAKAIRDADAMFVKAYNAGDPKAVAALFTEDAEALDEHGEGVVGRTEIEELYGDIFKEAPGAKLEIHLDGLRFPTADVAVATGRSKLSPATGGTESSQYTVVYVKKGEAWLQSFVREFAEKRASPHERLKALEWMLGEWVDEGADGVVHTTGRWADDKNFLLRDFTLQSRGKTAMTVTQRIGWDAGSGQFKSWVFDSEGGHSEGAWARYGNKWIVKAAGVLTDGRKSSATQVFTVVDKNTVRWRTVDRSIGGEAVADGGDIVLVRKPPKPR